MPPKTRPPSKAAAIACLAASGIALVFLSWVVVDSVRAARSNRWPETGAYIVHSGVRAGQGKSAGRYYPEVQYRYNAAGQIHFGTRITFGEDPYFQSSGEAASFVAKYPESLTVPVRYSATFPEVSVLLPGQLPPDFKGRAFPFLAGFVLFFALGWGMLRQAGLTPPSSGRL